jgi:hypothetical protein
VIAQRLHGRHPVGAHSGQERGEHADRHSEADRDHRGARPQDELARRERQPERVQQHAQPGGQTEPGHDPDRAGRRTDDGRLDQHRSRHLSAARTERAEQRELAGALRDGDRERVEDAGAGHEQRHAGEREQPGRHRPEERWGPATGVLADRCGPQHLEAGGFVRAAGVADAVQRPRDRGGQTLGVHAVGGEHPQRGGAAEMLGGGAGVQCHRGPPTEGADVRAPSAPLVVGEGADNPGVDHRVAEHQPHLVAEGGPGPQRWRRRPRPRPRRPAHDRCAAPDRAARPRRSS